MDGKVPAAAGGKPTNASPGSPETTRLPPKKKYKKRQGPNQRHKRILQRNLSYLCNNVNNIQSITICLIEEDVLKLSEEEAILNNHVNDTTEKKLRALFGVIVRKDYRAYEILQRVLLKTGNTHVNDKLTKSENDFANDESETEEPKRKKKNKKKRRMLYVVSDDDSSTSEEEMEEDDFQHLDSSSQDLFELLLYVEWFLRTIHYHPQILYPVSRFESNKNLVSVLPFPEFNNCVQRFKADRSVFLKSVGFFGPADFRIASYEITMKLVLESSVNKKLIIGEFAGVFEMKKNEITKVAFKKAHPIRPNTWHNLEFTIKGQNAMAVQANRMKLRTKECKYDDVLGSVTFDFDDSEEMSTCQLPELYFYRGKDSIPVEYFPLEDANDLHDVQTLYTAERFETQEQIIYSAPIEEFKNSIQRFKVDRPIFLRKIGFFGPHSSPVASYHVTLKLMAWKDIDEPYIISKTENLIEAKRGETMYITFQEAPYITPHAWHWIDFTITGEANVGVKQESAMRQEVVVSYPREGISIEGSSVKFEFDITKEHSTRQMPEFTFYKASGYLSSHSHSLNTVFHELTPDAQKLYTAYRFNEKELMDIPVIPSKRFKNTCQRFKVNRAIYLKKVGFFGPAREGCVASYEVKLKIVARSIKKPPVLIASKEKIVEVEHGKIMYLSFEKAQLIRPHVWHWLDFSIKGDEEMIVQNKQNKVKYYQVEYQHGGDVQFKFDMTPCHSTCQMPELWFYKGKENLELSKFPGMNGNGVNPSTISSTEENQKAVQDLKSRHFISAKRVIT